MTELDNDTPINAIYLNLRKTFDTVPSQKTPTKVRSYGNKSHLLEWIQDFPTDRTPYVAVNGKCSGKIRVTSEVPQGSVLGPTLFICYMNKMICPIGYRELAKLVSPKTRNDMPNRIQRTREARLT